MAPVYCPCHYESAEHQRFSPDWYRGHRDHHLAVFPDVDQGTRDTLSMLIERAEYLAAQR